MGVSACATCDGFFYRKKVVAVVGGGDTACEEAIYLAGLARQVYLVVRKPFLRASKIMQERVLNHPNIKVLFEHNAVGLYGTDGVEGMHVVKRLGEADEERYDVAIDGFFLAIGHQPNSAIFKPWVQTDETGYIITEGNTPRTGIPGVFAAGDVADPHYRQAITAAGSGCKVLLKQNVTFQPTDYSKNKSLNYIIMRSFIRKTFAAIILIGGAASVCAQQMPPLPTIRMCVSASWITD